MQHKLLNVDALWPKLDRPYKFDPAQNRSMPTEATDPDGKYEVNLIVQPEQAKELAKVMVDAFKSKAQADWPAWSPKGLDDIFKKDESGCYIVKLTKKTYGEANSKPKQFDDKGQPCADDFQLTSGSKVHAMVGVRPWKYAGKSGVTLRPEAIKWVELKERIMADPFSDGSAPAPANDDPFGLPASQAKAAPSAADSFDDEIPF